MGEPPDPYSPDDEVGVALPAATAFLGLSFVCCALLVTGLPPLAGFIAKFALVAAAIAATLLGANELLVLSALEIVGGRGRKPARQREGRPGPRASRRSNSMQP